MISAKFSAAYSHPNLILKFQEGLNITSRKGFYKQGEQLGALLYDHVPSGVVESMLAHLLDKFASEYESNPHLKEKAQSLRAAQDVFVRSIS